MAVYVVKVNSAPGYSLAHLCPHLQSAERICSLGHAQCTAKFRENLWPALQYHADVHNIMRSWQDCTMLNYANSVHACAALSRAIIYTK